MRCPQCQHDQKYKYGLVCQGCGYRFVFDKRQCGFTDGRFFAAIRVASQEGTAHFTSNQLYAVFAQKQLNRFAWLGITIVFGLIPGIILSIVQENGWFLLLTLLAGIAGALFHYSGMRKSPIKPTQFRSYLARWKKKGYARFMDHYIDKPTLHEPPPEWPERDMYDYGAERLLLVEKDYLVDWLVKNNLHTDHRSLIMSINGYPDYLLPKANRLLEQRPDLPVYLLHHASGVTMSTTLTSSKKFRIKDHPVTDLGVFPHQMTRIKGFKHLPITAKLAPVDLMAGGPLFQLLANAIAQSQSMYEADDDDLWSFALEFSDFG
ncbi:MAG: hypothetical protein MI864_26515 [Pseudomonadales bacterium]|nr:hypothetical protein [Pseudomonadales bacterium]